MASIYNPNVYTEGAPPLASALWDDLLDSIAKESTEGSESEVASILADQARGQLDLLYSSGLPENEKAAVLADYLQRSGFSADIVPQLSGGEFTKEDVVSTLAKYGYDSRGQQLPSTEERGAILGEDYPFANQAFETTEVTQDTVNQILSGAMAARQEIMENTAFPTSEQELAVQAAVADLFADAGIAVDQSTINPYSLEGDSLGRFVDRITVVDEAAESSSSVAAEAAAADSSSDSSADSSADSTASLDNELLEADSALGDTTLSDDSSIIDGVTTTSTTTDSESASSYGWIYENGGFVYAPFDIDGNRLPGGERVSVGDVSGTEGKVFSEGETVNIIDLGDGFELEHGGAAEDTGGVATNTTVDLSGLLDITGSIVAGGGLVNDVINNVLTDTTDTTDTTDNADGLDGADGADGNDGLDGLDGTDGLDGAQGATGAQGAQGAQGATGAAGAAGEQGEKGEAGKDGMIGLFSRVINETPIADSILFEPKFTKLDNIPVGMFERFMQATGGR